VKYEVIIEIPKQENITLELDDKLAPQTVKSLLEKLPFSVSVNLWGEEIYTDETPIKMDLENPKPLVQLNDVAYWPTGKAICLFYGQTPIGKKDEIKPYSPVNIIGKITNPKKNILSKIRDGVTVTIRLPT
jgi:hypothetical protein